MKNMMKMAIMGAVLVAGLIQSSAGVLLATNRVAYNVNITLSGKGQATDTTTDPVKLTTKQLIAALGTATSNSFSAQAKLLLLADINGGGGPSFVVRQKTGTNIVDVDVSNILHVETLGSSVKNIAASGKTGADYSIVHIVLDQNVSGDDFDVQGAGVSTKGAIRSKGQVLEPLGTLSFSAQVSGTGNIKASGGAGISERSILSGTASATAGKVEPIPAPPN
jgi:hypothetical protein